MESETAPFTEQNQGPLNQRETIFPLIMHEQDAGTTKNGPHKNNCGRVSLLVVNVEDTTVVEDEKPFG